MRGQTQLTGGRGVKVPLNIRSRMQVFQSALSLALCWCLVSVVSTANAPPNPGLQQNRLGKLDPKPGEFLNCGNASTKAHLTWRPSKLRFGDTVYVDFHVVPPEDLSMGYIRVWAYLPGQTEPIYYSGDGSAFNCQDIHMYAKFIRCPFYKDKDVNVKQFKFYLAPSTGIPTGNYIIKIQILNVHKKELFCIYGNVVVLDD